MQLRIVFAGCLGLPSFPSQRARGRVGWVRGEPKCPQSPLQQQQQQQQQGSCGGPAWLQSRMVHVASHAAARGRGGQVPVGLAVRAIGKALGA